MRIKYRPNDYEARLNGGVVLWDGVPHRILTDGDEIAIHDLVSGRVVQRRVNPMDDKLDVSSFELGYLNSPEGAVYVTRVPHRRYKQSIDNRSLREYRLSAYGPEERGGCDYLYSDGFRDAFSGTVGKFPKFDKAVKKLEEVASVALSRDIALTTDDLGLIKVWFKLEQVGYMHPGTRKVIVPASDKAWIISVYLSELEWEVE